MSAFDPRTVEPKWQERWERAGVFRAATAATAERSFYCLEMLPYPSGRLHMGHVRNYTIGDAVARFERMRGHDVMHVLGWDAFGLPAENAAIQNGEDPRRWTERNIAAMRAQVRRLGLGYDWTREVATCDPSYYRWNQWFFLRMLERGLAYRARRRLNFCETCGTVLANEQVIDGRCWRCDQPVRLREFDQWFLRVTAYAQELLDGIDTLSAWPERVRTMQENWIGRSTGARVRFSIEGFPRPIEIFTTRIDTIYGATYLALAAEHPELDDLVRGTPSESAVRRFVEEQQGKSLEERFAEGAAKLGVPTGRTAIHPFSGARIPLWVANFVLTDVGTGAIMGVPAHDERDRAFAQTYGLPIVTVIRGDGEAPTETAMTEPGRLIESGPYSGLDSAEATRRMIEDADRGGFGRAETVFRIKDWGVSRQRMWGTPIPVVECPAHGIVPVPDAELPVELPAEAPLTGEGGSPLAKVASFVETRCPRCGGPARRETDTMDTFVDSSWYFFRYLDPRNESAPFDGRAIQGWVPVDLYIGGIEHATMHLIYTRFWTRVMRDLGLIGIDEPVRRLFTQGMVIKDGAKMSKSKGNVVDPDRMVERYGADTTRLFCLFAAPPEKDLEWSEAGVEGCQRFLARVARTFERARPSLPEPGVQAPARLEAEALALRRKTHDTIRRVTDDLGERMRFNTAVAAIMELINQAAPSTESESVAPDTAWALREAFEVLARLLAPMAPHFAEELWERLGQHGFVLESGWPAVDPALLVLDEVTLVVQVNGKLRARLTVPRGCPEDDAVERARREPGVAPWVERGSLARVVYVPDRLLNLVVSS
jgi:leucyl-tRNA synthetase